MGIVTKILDDLNVDSAKGAAIVCGPPIMMKYATRGSWSSDSPFRHLPVDGEEHVLRSRQVRALPDRAHYACKDGPVFRYDEIKDLPEIWV